LPKPLSPTSPIEASLRPLPPLDRSLRPIPTIAQIDNPLRPMSAVQQPQQPVQPPRSPITCHALDSTAGKPCAGMSVRLDRLTSNGFALLSQNMTDNDGRCTNLMQAGSRLDIGIYKITFFSAEYFTKRGITSFYPFVEVTFEVKDDTQHYHIPLLLAPFSYSTYRGS